MKIFIGFALLSVAFAISPIALPEPAQPALEGSQPVEADGSKVLIAELPMFQTPDISPAFIEPALASILNDLGEIRQDLLLNMEFDYAAISPVLFVDHADEVAEVVPQVEDVDIEISPVLFVDGPFEAEQDTGAVDSVLFVDAPLEAEEAAVDAVLVADGPIEADDASAVVDPVLVADGPIEVEEVSAVVDPVLVADGPIETEEASAVVDPVLVADGPIEAEDTSAVVDPVVFVDGPIEAEDNSAVVDYALAADTPVESEVVDSVLVADGPLADNAQLAQAPLPSALEQFLRKLLAGHYEGITRDNAMLR